MTDLSDYISDYASSEHFLFLDPVVKPQAESLLTEWCRRAGKDITAAAVEKSLGEIARLDLPLEARKALPALLKEFFSYLASSGRLPPAGQWAGYVSQCEKKYLDGFRDDGTVRGETFKKKYTDVGRNDPCPCGSGKKFKKCCMELIA
jgi:hypothetical protein